MPVSLVRVTGTPRYVLQSQYKPGESQLEVPITCGKKNKKQLALVRGKMSWLDYVFYGTQTQVSWVEVLDLVP